MTRGGINSTCVGRICPAKYPYNYSDLITLIGARLIKLRVIMVVVFFFFFNQICVGIYTEGQYDKLKYNNFPVDYFRNLLHHLSIYTNIKPN